MEEIKKAKRLGIGTQRSGCRIRRSLGVSYGVLVVDVMLHVIEFFAPYAATWTACNATCVLDDLIDAVRRVPESMSIRRVC
jgi:hypothetical protein